MVKRWGAVALIGALALVGTSCAKKSDGESGGKAGGAGRYVVQVDAKKAGQELNVHALKYFPAEVTVHAGDAVEFAVNWSGEPHSVSFGTLVDAGAAKLGPQAQDDPAEWKKIPQMLPEGPGDANPVSANPCFVESGDPTKETCAKEQPQLTGKQTFYSSGIIGEDEKFTVKLATDIAAGTYNYFCTLHRGGMLGKIVVVDKSEKVPSPGEVKEKGDEDIAAYVAAAKTTFAGAAKGGPGGSILAGFGDQEGKVHISQFTPSEVKAKIGQPVKWTIIGPHTVTFNAPEDAVSAVTKAPDGWHLNPKAMGPAKAPPAAPTKETGNVVDAGTWNGEGFFNSGFLPGFGPPGYLTWQVKFGKAGTYKFICVVHPDMEGSVTVA